MVADSAAWKGGEFRHEAMLYAGEEEFLAGAVPFIKDAVQSDEPILVVVSAAKIALLRDRLGNDAEAVQFADMAAIGTNPARIIPAWVDFVAENSGDGRRLRGIGEAIWRERGPAELIECQRHEALLNTAFEETSDFWLLCPYDTTGLDPEVIDEAHRSHPYVFSETAERESPTYRGPDNAVAHFDAALPAPPPDSHVLTFEKGPMREVRKFVGDEAIRAGLGPEAVQGFVLAAGELVTNSIRHGGGGGTLAIWSEGESVICDVRDQGRFPHALIDRTRPSASSDGGRGLWLVNQLCDLVQLRSFPNGTAVRAHLHRR